MSQSINFLKTLPQNTSRLPAATMGWIILVILLIFMMISIIFESTKRQLHHSFEIAQQNLQLIQKNYDKLAKNYPFLASDIPFVQQINTIEKEFKAKRAQVEALEHLIRRRGFSHYMSDLAQITPHTLWLNHIQIDDDSESITINGYAIDPDSVSELMSKLSTTDSFKRVIFNSFFVKAIKNYAYLKFSIATNSLGLQGNTVIKQNDVNLNAQGVK